MSKQIGVVNHVSVNRNHSELNRMMREMEQMKAAIEEGGEQKASCSDFSHVLKDAISKTNDLQNETESLRERYELGDKDVSISDVMLSQQKSNVALQATLQVQKRLINIYKDIMNQNI